MKKDKFKDYKKNYWTRTSIQLVYFILILILISSSINLISYRGNKILQNSELLNQNLQNKILYGEDMTPEEELNFKDNLKTTNDFINFFIFISIINLILITLFKVIKDCFVWKVILNKKTNLKQRISLFLSSIIFSIITIYSLIIMLNKKTPIAVLNNEMIFSAGFVFFMFLVIGINALIQTVLPFIIFKESKNKFSFKKLDAFLLKIKWKKVGAFILNYFIFSVIYFLTIILLFFISTAFQTFVMNNIFNVVSVTGTLIAFFIIASILLATFRNVFVIREIKKSE